jgi:outer membrane receptor protein involved in Fe transport
VGVLLLFSLSASAQTQTGRIQGQVVGVDGIRMAGATIIASSDVVMGGTRSTVSDASGDYRFAALPPGVYTVTASMEGHQSQTIEGVTVRLGASASADFMLIPEFSDEIAVMGESPLVDTTSSSVDASFSADFIKDLPTQRNFYDIISVAPDVSLATEDSDRMVAGGSNVQSNNWFIDGIETTAPETGTAWIYTNPDDIQEVQIMHIGAPAEYGNMLGATFNVVTKSGSNEFKGGINAYWFDDNLVDSQIDFDSEFPEYHVNEFTDISTTLGGPISRDRLWFYASYEYYRFSQTYPGSDPDPALNPGWYSDRYAAKLSWRLNNSNLIDIKGGFVDWGYPPSADPYTTKSAQAGEKGQDKSWGINYQSIFSDSTFMEVRYTGFTVFDDYLSETGSTEAAYIDYSPPGGGPALYSGGLLWPWTYDTTSDRVTASVTHYADDWLAGDHDFKFGVQASRGTADTMVAPSMQGVYYYHYTYDYYGDLYEYYYKVEGLPYFYGNEQDAVGVFVDDSWRISDNLTLNLGVRYDYHKGAIPSYPRLNPDGTPSSETIPGQDPVFTWNNISPRLGFAWDVGGNAKTVIRGSFGVYYDGNVGGNWNAPAIGHPGLFAYLGESWDGPWDDEPAWDWFPGGEVNVDPDLKAPQTLQYSIGFEQAIGTDYSFGVTLLYKDTKNLVGWEVMGDGEYEELPWTDPFTGDSYTLLDPIVYPTVRKGNRPGYTVDGFLDKYWQEYKALILTFERRFSDFWSMQANYTYSESTGIIAAYMSQYQSNPLYGSLTGSDPNSFLNADGQRLQGDRPHMFRVQANFQLPWQMRLNTMINLQSGRPYSRLFRVPTEGRPDAVVAPAGDPGRHGFQYNWDLGWGKAFNLGKDVAFQVDLQLLNVLNKTPTDWFHTTTLAEGDEFVPSWWVKPRRLQLHFGIEF